MLKSAWQFTRTQFLWSVYSSPALCSVSVSGFQHLPACAKILLNVIKSFQIAKLIRPGSSDGCDLQVAAFDTETIDTTATTINNIESCIFSSSRVENICTLLAVV